MDIKDFKAGSYKQQYRYKSFMPELINKAWVISDNSLINILSEANIKLGELNVYSQLVPDVSFFIKMHISKEATTSSRIEGTQTTITDALQKFELIVPEKRDDWLEVNNYVMAMEGAISLLNELPISNRLMRATHKVLLQGARGEHKQPGEYRQSQNWIGGASLNDATFIPPAANDLPGLLTDLEKFINNVNDSLPDLIKIGMAHYQFETIHPFLDGNGRMGRLLITLFLVERKLLTKPSLYISAFFDKHRQLYYDNLTRVRTHNEMTQWLKFFLEGVKSTAESSIETLKAVVVLREELEEIIAARLGRKTKLAQSFLLYLFKHPVIESEDAANALSVNKSTANRLIADFIHLGVLTEITGYKRNKIFKFARYIRLFE